MRHQLPLLKRLTVLGLAGLLTAGALGSVLASQACRHMAMHHVLHHGVPTGRSCWCHEMTGGVARVQPAVEALPPATTVLAPPASGVVTTVFYVRLIPESPSFPPTPPPPNERAS
jgi:hypothetical protein